MRILYRRCAALDIHKHTVCACIREVRAKDEVVVERATFGTVTKELQRLGTWLKQHKVRRVAMESTGVYWIPVWNILEQKRFGLELLLVNPATVKALPGQKTDPKDAARIAELHQYGLLRGSFIPPVEIRELRDLVRRRTHLQQEKNRIVNRIAGLLERANIKLGSVASNVVGVSGRRMLYALAEGETDPDRLAALALGVLQKKKDDLRLALEGRFNSHFRLLLNELLEDLRHVEKKVCQLEERIRQAVAPHREVMDRLCTIPSVDEVTAWTIVSEIGFDMSVFPTASHLASWAGLCPGNDESAGKRRSGRARKGNRYLRRTLIQNAWSISRSENCFLTSVFLRISHRRGMKRAALAVAHRILVIAFHIIRDGSVYRELGGSYHDKLDPQKTTRRLVARLSSLGYEVELRPQASAADVRPGNETGAVGKRGRGRPPGSKDRGPRSRRTQPSCPKCADRGIPCIHAGQTARPTTIPNDVQCRMCAGWGIPCIHVRNTPRDSKPLSPE